MAKKTYIYMVEVGTTYSKEREGNQVSLNPYSSFEKAKKAVDDIYDQCVKEAEKYPRMSVTEKQSTWVPDDEVKFLAWTFTWTVKAGLVDEEYTVKIKRLEVQ
ncbi:MAG: hypothetical protein J6Y02_11850 [Pseudobutyrivibrio sp.]|nr:hypothetical protein [Pseudobutyrivibrio sp.]